MSVEIKNAIAQLIAMIEKQPQVANSVFRASSHSEADSFAVRSQNRGFTTTARIGRHRHWAQPG